MHWSDMQAALATYGTSWSEDARLGTDWCNHPNDALLKYLHRSAGIGEEGSLSVLPDTMDLKISVPKWEDGSLWFEAPTEPHVNTFF